MTDDLNQFLCQVERRAYRTALFACRNADDALDIMQDSMLSFIKSYRARPSNEWPVLFQRVLQSRITDSARRDRVRNRFRFWFGSRNSDAADATSVDPIQLLPDINTSDQISRMVDQEFSQALDAALRRLPLRQRQAFLLRHWEGFDVAQTAMAMGCSEGSVKTHTSRALHALQKELEEFRP